MATETLVQLDDQVAQALQEIASQQGVTFDEVMQRAIQTYVREQTERAEGLARFDRALADIRRNIP